MADLSLHISPVTKALCSWSSEVAVGHLAWPFPACHTEQVPTLGYLASEQLQVRHLHTPALKIPWIFASSFCQLYREYRHAVAVFIFTQLSKDTVKWITCSTCIHCTKINRTQPQDLSSVFKALAWCWTWPWWKRCLRWHPLSQGLTAPNPTEWQGSYLAANTAWTSHLTSQLGKGIPATKAALRKQLKKVQRHCQDSNFISRFTAKCKHY